MKIFPRYSKKTILKIGLIVSLVVILTTIGGNLWFRHSDEWGEIKKLIYKSPVVGTYVGNVEKVSLPLFGVSYTFGREWAKADLNVNVTGNIKSESFNVIAEKNHRKWNIVNISKN